MMIDQADASSRRATHRRLCAHADEEGQGAHWLEPGETCDRPHAADLLESEGCARPAPTSIRSAAWWPGSDRARARRN